MKQYEKENTNKLKDIDSNLNDFFLSSKNVLFFGIGNPSRSDDGLGVEFVSECERWIRKFPKIRIDFQTNYQLNIEDALEISRYDHLLFVDALKNQDQDRNFIISKIKSNKVLSFSTHALSLETVLSLSEELYSKKPEAYLLAIQGYNWDIGENISPKALQNLNSALKFIKSQIAGDLDGSNS